MRKTSLGPSGRKFVLFAGLVLVLSGCAHFGPLADLPAERSTDPATGNFWEASYSEESGLNYIITFPAEYDSTASGGSGSGGSENEPAYPLIIFLHSLEERGEEIEKLINNPEGEGKGLAAYALAAEKFPFLTVSPLCPKGTGWPMITARLSRLLEEVSTSYPVDSSRIYLTGVSMGGMGTWSWGMAAPEQFAAIAPISGGIYTPPMERNPEALTAVPVWAFHDRYDPSIPLKKEEGFVEEVLEAGGSVRYTVTEEGRHYIHTSVYAAGDLFDWFLEQ